MRYFKYKITDEEFATFDVRRDSVPVDAVSDRSCYHCEHSDTTWLDLDLFYRLRCKPEVQMEAKMTGKCEHFEMEGFS